MMKDMDEMIWHFGPLIELYHPGYSYAPEGCYTAYAYDLVVFSVVPKPQPLTSKPFPAILLHIAIVSHFSQF